MLPAKLLLTATTLPVAFAGRLICADITRFLDHGTIRLTVHVEQGVDQYQMTSWRGGDSWHKALEAALAPLDLAATYSGRGLEIVQIKLVGAAAAAAPALRPWERAEIWHAEPDRDLQDVAREWGRRVGVTPVFRGDYSYPVEVPLTFRGTFADAMNYLIKAFSTASPPPLIHQWADQDNFAVQIILGNP